MTAELVFEKILRPLQPAPDGGACGRMRDGSTHSKKCCSSVLQQIHDTFAVACRSSHVNKCAMAARIPKKSLKVSSLLI